ncbi:MAG TPA: LysR family transcriptional regulator [Syntrophorhabdaceae bacterium]|nr:LysR family transcriptional regulator [Syntrophorhabdaceae bacterium]
MNLNQLRVFYITAKELNFSKAAEKLSISQPAVSLHIKNLEELLKVKLFLKAGKKILLTEPGNMLFDYANKIFELEIQAESALKGLLELKQGSIHIGTTKTYARYLMPKFISKFHSRYPQINITLNEGSSQEMIQSLFSHRNELAIVAHTDYPKTITTIEFHEEEVIFVASPKHPICIKEELTLEEIANAPIIMREEGSGTRKIIMNVFKEKGLMPTILYEASNLDFIKELLISGEGISFMVKPVVQKEIDLGLLKELKIKDVKFVMYSKIAFLSNKALSKPASAFIDMLLQK